MGEDLGGGVASAKRGTTGRWDMAHGTSTGVSNCLCLLVDGDAGLRRRGQGAAKIARAVAGVLRCGIAY